MTLLPALKGRRHNVRSCPSFSWPSLAAQRYSRSRRAGRSQSRPIRRLAALKNLDGEFLFQPIASPDAWKARSAELRRQLQVALGLWPMPEATPLNAVVHGAVTRQGYTVEKVFFESLPGHFVTGSLYRPTGRQGRLPAVLLPHGHWERRAIHGNAGQGVQARARDRRRALRSRRPASAAGRAGAAGEDGRHRLPLRPRRLRRQRADPERRRARRPEGRPKDSPAAPGLFFHAQADSRLRVDHGAAVVERAARSGFPHQPARRRSLADLASAARAAAARRHSSSARSTIVRPAVFFPMVMVGTRMQGGCTCENADYLRIGTGNVEIASLLAPRPVGMTTADDWTKTMPETGFPRDAGDVEDAGRRGSRRDLPDAAVRSQLQLRQPRQRCTAG